MHRVHATAGVVARSDPASAAVDAHRMKLEPVIGKMVRV